jgi:hypothetical protein
MNKIPVKLVKNCKVCTLPLAVRMEVEKMIILGHKYSEIIEFAKGMGYHLNDYNISNHKTKHTTTGGVTFDRQIDKHYTQPLQGIFQSGNKKVQTDIDFLDAVINLAAENLDSDTTVNAQTAIRAMEEKRKQVQAQMINSIMNHPQVKLKIQKLFGMVFDVVGRYVDGVTLEKIRGEIAERILRSGEDDKRLPAGSGEENQ